MDSIPAGSFTMGNNNAVGPLAAAHMPERTVTIGAFQMIRAVAPHMEAAGKGAVVNVSSVAGVYSIGSSLAYIGSKGALNAITIAMARALGPAI